MYQLRTAAPLSDSHLHGNAVNSSNLNNTNNMHNMNSTSNTDIAFILGHFCHPDNIAFLHNVIFKQSAVHRIYAGAGDVFDAGVEIFLDKVRSREIQVQVYASPSETEQTIIDRANRHFVHFFTDYLHFLNQRYSSLHAHSQQKNVDDNCGSDSAATKHGGGNDRIEHDSGGDVDATLMDRSLPSYDMYNSKSDRGTNKSSSQVAGEEITDQITSSNINARHLERRRPTLDLLKRAAVTTTTERDGDGGNGGSDGATSGGSLESASTVNEVECLKLQVNRLSGLVDELAAKYEIMEKKIKTVRGQVAVAAKSSNRPKLNDKEK